MGTKPGSSGKKRVRGGLISVFGAADTLPLLRRVALRLDPRVPLQSRSLFMRTVLEWVVVRSLSFVAWVSLPPRSSRIGYVWCSAALLGLASVVVWSSVRYRFLGMVPMQLGRWAPGRTRTRASNTSRKVALAWGSWRIRPQSCVALASFVGGVAHASVRASWQSFSQECWRSWRTGLIQAPASPGPFVQAGAAFKCSRCSSGSLSC